MQGAVDLSEARIAGVEERDQGQQLFLVLRVGEGLPHNNSGEGRADIALDACQCPFKGVRGVPFEIDSVEVCLEGNLIWWDPETLGLNGIECQQVRLLPTLVRDSKGGQVTLRHVVMTPSDHGSLIDPTNV
jgi:hypothetical protein